MLETPPTEIEVAELVWTASLCSPGIHSIARRLAYQCNQLQHTVVELQERFMLDGGEPHYSHCCEYSDELVVNGVPRYGNLSRLEWMLQVVVGYSRRQANYIKDLEAAIDKSKCPIAKIKTLIGRPV